MGEGWSDWLAIALTARPGDTGEQARGIGTYVLYQPDRSAKGIRPKPYSTNKRINNATYNSIKSEAIPHGVGYVWATMLNEVYWGLVADDGFNPDVYDHCSTGGNNLAIQLVMDGMKMQPCSPGFVDGRDAILAADVALTGGANKCTVWNAFAKRELGFGASQGDSKSRSDGTQSLSTASPPTTPEPCHRRHPERNTGDKTRGGRRDLPRCWGALCSPLTSRVRYWRRDHDRRSTTEGQQMRCLHRATPLAVAAALLLTAAPAHAADQLCAGRVATIVGTAEDDRLVGTDRNDVIVGLGGHDRIRGAGGDDVVCGGDGFDRMFGGDGDDTLIGGAGGDSLLAGAGSDHLVGDDGRDGMWGRTGADRLDGGADSDSLYGGSDDDVLIGGANTPCTTPLCRKFPDTERLAGGPGDDRLDGGDGVDIARRWGGLPVTIDLEAGTATTAAHADVLLGIENAMGTSHDDVITGTDGDNFINGLDGDDTITGAGGTDHLRGRVGADAISGGGGADFVRGGRDDDTLRGDTGNDRVVGSPGEDAVAGGAGNDTLFGGSGPDTVNGDDGDDRLVGRAENDTLTGGAGTDSADGGTNDLFPSDEGYAGHPLEPDRLIEHDTCAAETVKNCEEQTPDAS